MLSHLAKVATFAVLANVAINSTRKRGYNFQKSRFATRYGEPQFPQSFRKIGLAGGLRNLRQQPERMREALVLRCPFEPVFCGVGACSGDMLDISAASNQVDDLLPLLRFRKRTEANVTHRLPVKVSGSGPLIVSALTHIR